MGDTQDPLLKGGQESPTIFPYALRREKEYPYATLPAVVKTGCEAETTDV